MWHGRSTFSQETSSSCIRSEPRSNDRESGRSHISCVYISDLPPSTGISIPVMKSASSLAKKAAAFPMSLGVAIRPNGIAFNNTARPSSESVPPSTLATIPVSATTGQMALHRIPSLANSAARPFVMAETAPLEPKNLRVSTCSTLKDETCLGPAHRTGCFLTGERSALEQ